MASNLIHVCEEEGVQLGRLFISKSPVTKKATATFFELKDGSTIYRLLIGERSCERVAIILQVMGANKEDTLHLGRQVYNILDGHSPFVSKDHRYRYLSVLALGPMIQVDLDANERFMFEAVFSVLRKEL